MKKILSILGCILIAATIYAGTTTNFGWNYGTKGQAPWWDTWATIFQAIDTELYGVKLKTDAWVDVRSHGAKFDNITDDTIAWNNAFIEAQITGLAIMAPTGSSYIPGQLILPNDGSSPPKQRPIKIIGAGNWTSGVGGLPFFSSGTVLRMTYSGGPKLITTGLGTLEISGVTFYDDTDGTQSFIYTTNTALKIHDNTFWGKTPNTPTQDGIILGGTTVETGFQGYGTVIKNNYFNNLRKCIYGRIWANGIPIYANTFFNGCGGGATDAAIVFDGVNGVSVACGNQIMFNLFEMPNYVYGILMDSSQGNSLIGNSFYDPGGSTLAAIRCATNSNHESIIMGFKTNTWSDISTVNANHNLITPTVGAQQIFRSPILFTGEVELNNLGSGPKITDAPGNFWKTNVTSSIFHFAYTPIATGVEIETFTLQKHASESIMYFNLLGTVDNYVRSITGPIRISAKAGEPAFIGDPNIYWIVNGGVLYPGPGGKIRLASLPVYANNAAAISGGLVAGDFYRTGADPDVVCVVH